MKWRNNFIDNDLNTVFSISADEIAVQDFSGNGGLAPPIWQSTAGQRWSALANRDEWCIEQKRRVVLSFTAISFCLEKRYRRLKGDSQAVVVPLIYANAGKVCAFGASC